MFLHLYGNWNVPNDFCKIKSNQTCCFMCLNFLQSCLFASALPLDDKTRYVSKCEWGVFACQLLSQERPFIFHSRASINENNYTYTVQTIKQGKIKDINMFNSSHLIASINRNSINIS